MRLSVLTLLAVLGMAGCQSAPVDAEKDPAQLANNVVVDADRVRQTWAREIRRDVLAGRYDRADSIASHLRRADERWPSGQHKLGTLYFEGFGDDLGGSESDAAWGGLVDRIEAWRSQRPRSITAPVALAYAYTGWAWFARGGGPARGVSKSAAQLFAERLDRARVVLDEARSASERCPYWYSAALTVGLGQGWPRDAMEAVHREGVAANPHCWILHKKMAAYLMPRWYGAPGEWERFALDAASTYPEPERDMLYAELIWYLEPRHVNIFDETTAAWFRVHHGFDELLRRYPGSVELESAYAKLAALAGDRTRARAALQRLDGKWDSSVWRSGSTYWQAYRWAMGSGESE